MTNEQRAGEIVRTWQREFFATCHCPERDWPVLIQRIASGMAEAEKVLTSALRLLTTCDTCSGTGIMTCDCYSCMGESRGCPDCNDTNRVEETCAACDGDGIYCREEIRALAERLHKAERESQKNHEKPAET